MKKAILVILAMLVCLLSFSMNSWAINRTSVSLKDENIMLSNISQPSSGVPLGSVIIWAYGGMPQDKENWRICNGQSLAGTELCKQTGQCTAPDYQGFFLRGIGGKSAGLGQIQTESVHLPESSGAKMEIKGITTGQYTYTDSDAGANYGDDYGGHGISHKTAFFVSEKNVKNRWCINCDDYHYSDNIDAIGIGDKMEVPINIISQTGETRPTNKAVYYLIKVN